MDFKLNHRGAEEVLKKLARHEINALARKIADKAVEAAESDDAVTVDTYTTDRAVASVSVPAALQAKDGVLTRAAAELGLDVKLR